MGSGHIQAPIRTRRRTIRESEDIQASWSNIWARRHVTLKQLTTEHAPSASIAITNTSTFFRDTRQGYDAQSYSVVSGHVATIVIRRDRYHNLTVDLHPPVLFVHFLQSTLECKYNGSPAGDVDLQEVLPLVPRKRRGKEPRRLVNIAMTSERLAVCTKDDTVSTLLLYTNTVIS